MTQAYNLSQLANNLDSSGRLDATDGLVNAVPVANGGTGASTASGARSNLGAASGTMSAFDFYESGSVLYIRFNGATIVSIDSSGNIVSEANVTAYGSV